MNFYLFCDSYPPSCLSGHRAQVKHPRAILIETTTSRWPDSEHFSLSFCFADAVAHSHPLTLLVSECSVYLLWYFSSLHLLLQSTDQTSYSCVLDYLWNCQVTDVQIQPLKSYYLLPIMGETMKILCTIF